MTDANPSFVLGALMSSKDNRFINNEYCTNYLQYLSCQHLSFSLVRLILDRRSAIIKFIQLGHQHNSIFRYLPPSNIAIKSVSVTRGVKKNDLQSRYAKLFSTIKSKLFFCQYWVVRFPVGENFTRKGVSFSTIQSVLMKFSSLITREARSKVFSPLY